VPGGGEAGRAAEGVIAKLVKTLVKSADKDLVKVAGRDAERTAARDAERAAARDATRTATRDAEEQAARDAGRRADREAAQRAADRRVGADPVDLATGEVVLSQVDADLAGALPLLLSRTHVSSYRDGRFFGASWASTVDQRLELSGGGARLFGADAMILHYPTATPGDGVLPTAGSARWTLAQVGSRYTVTDPETGQVRWFGLPDGEVASTLPLVAITDRTGRHRIDIDRDRTGMPTLVRHSGGYRIAVDSADGLITGLRLLGAADGDTVTLASFEYDDRRLVAALDTHRTPMRMGYDADGRIAWWVDRIGTGYGYRYDEVGRCVAAGGPSGHMAARFDYADGRRTTHTDSLGAVWAYELNEVGQIVRETDPLGHATEQVWDGADRLVARTDPLGHVTRWEYDAACDLVAVTDPLGGTRTAAYNAAHQAVEVVGPDGRRWAAEYDDAGRLVAVTDPGGARTAYGFRDGLLATVTDALGRRQEFETDAAGLVVAMTDPDGTREAYARDAFGRVTTVVDAAGGTTRYGWTAQGWLAWRVLPDGATDRWEYDGEGNQVAHVDALGQATTTEYTAFDLPAAATDADGRRTLLAYDTELRLTAVTDPAGRTWSYRYDPAGRLVAETDYRGRTVSFDHDAAGRLVSRVNASGQRVDHRRDAAGAIVATRRLEPGGAEEVLEFARDAAGRIVRATGPGTELTRAYDAAGRLVEETTDGRTLVLVHDEVGRLVGRRTPAGVVSSWEYGPAHDRPLALHTGGQSVRFGYDPLRREVARRVGPDLLVTQDWDAASRLRGLDARAGTSGPVARRGWAYRADGIPDAVTDLLDGHRDVALDPVGRIEAVTGPQWTEQYAYDATGARAGGGADYRYDADGQHSYGGGYRHDADGQHSYGADYRHDADGQHSYGADYRYDADGQHSYGADYRYDADGQHSYGGAYRYDADGQHSYGGGYRYDADGRVVARTERTLSGQARTWRQVWNADDQLVEVVTPEGARWRYRYDPLGRRTAKELLGADGEVTDRTVFCWDGTRLAEQTRGDRSTTWDYRPGTYQPITQTDGLDQSEVDRRFAAIVTDLVGAPTELVTPAGEVAWRQRRTAWGQPVSGGGSVDCPLRFPGQYADAETGLHYNLARHYDPATGRYLTPDPLGLVGGPDPHAYVPNPMAWLDPLGLACRKVYRQLSAADREAFDAGEGLTPHGTSRDIAAHIRGEPTRHISASLERGQTERFASGNGLVEINVEDAIAGGSKYIDHGNVMSAAGRAADASRLRRDAARAGEVLFVDTIPFNAMRLVG
jgi:RHS repeat-associated protein